MYLYSIKYETIRLLPIKLYHVDWSAHMLLLMNVTSHSNNLLVKKRQSHTLSPKHRNPYQYKEWLTDASSSLFIVNNRAWWFHIWVFGGNEQCSRTKTSSCIVLWNRVCYLMSESFLLCVDDLSQAVSPHAALGPGAGLEDALLPRLQRPHSQTHEKLLSGDTQQISSPLQEVWKSAGLEGRLVTSYFVYRFWFVQSYSLQKQWEAGEEYKLYCFLY